MCQYLYPQVQKSKFVSPTTKEEIEKHIDTLSSKKQNDIYGMSPTSLNILAWSISGIWSTLVSESFLKRIFPDHMNLAMFTPVYKGGQNYIWQTKAISILWKNLRKTFVN